MRGEISVLFRVVFFFLISFIIGCASVSEIETADKLRNQGDKIQAFHLYKQSLEKLSSNSDRRVEVLKSIDLLSNDIAMESIAKADTVYGNKKNIVSTQRAIDVLEKSLPYDTKAGTIKKRLSQYKDILSELRNLYLRKMNDSSSAQTKNLWSEAYVLLEEAMGINPEDTSLNRALASLLKSRDEYYAQKINIELDNKNWNASQNSLLAYHNEKPAPDNETLQRFEAAVLRLKKEMIFKEADSLIAKGKYYTAVKKLQSAALPEATSYMSEVTQKGALYYKEKAENEMQKGGESNIGLAYIFAVKALALDPSNTQIFDLHRGLKDRVNHEIIVQIAVSGFGSANSDPQSGTYLSDSLVAYLVDHLPYGIEILERSKIDLMLKESGLELNELSKKLGVKLFIIGNVNTLDIEHQRSENDATVVVPVGKTVVPNPEYNQMLATYGSERTKWPHIPPLTIEKETTEMVKYKMGKERIKGLMNVSIRIFDAEKGSITVAKTFNAAEAAEDEFRDSVPAAGISYHALVLPTNNEIREKLVNSVVAQVADVVLKSFEKREWRYWESARARIERREIQLAVNELAKGYLYCTLEELMGTNKWCSQINEAALLTYTE